MGGLFGVLCVRHTWSRTLAYHPHVHCLVPAGGLSADRTEWRPARTSYLVPVHALSTLFRGLFLDLLCQERPDLPLPEALWTTGWVVYCKPTVQGTEQVLKYLGRLPHQLGGGELMPDRDVLYSIADVSITLVGLSAIYRPPAGHRDEEPVETPQVSFRRSPC